MGTKGNMTISKKSSHVTTLVILTFLLSAFFIHSSTIINYLPFKITSYNILRWIQLIALSFSCLIALSTLTHFRTRKLKIVIFSLTVFIMLISLFMTPSMVGAADTLLIALLFISGSVLSQSLRHINTNKYIEIVARGFLLVSILYLTQTLSALLAHCVYDLKCDTVEGNFLGFANKRQFNHIQVGLLPFCVWLSITCHNIWLKRCAAVTSAFLIWLLISLDARGAFIAIALSGGLIGIWHRWPVQQWLHILKLFSAAFIFWAITKIPSFLNDPSASGLAIRTNSAGRFELWKGAFSGSFNNVWLGNGPASFAAAGGAFSTPHNIILQVVYDYGYVVTISCIIWMVAVGAFSLKNPERNSWVLPWAIIGWLSYTLVSNPQTSPLGQTLFLTATVLMFSNFSSKSDKTFILNKNIKIIFGIAITTLSIIIGYIYLQISFYDVIRSAPRLFSHH